MPQASNFLLQNKNFDFIIFYKIMVLHFAYKIHNHNCLMDAWLHFAQQNATIAQSAMDNWRIPLHFGRYPRNCKQNRFLTFCKQKMLESGFAMQNAPMPTAYPCLQHNCAKRSILPSFAFQYILLCKMDQNAKPKQGQAKKKATLSAKHNLNL